MCFVRLIPFGLELYVLPMVHRHRHHTSRDQILTGIRIHHMENMDIGRIPSPTTPRDHLTKERILHRLITVPTSSTLPQEEDIRPTMLTLFRLTRRRMGTDHP